MDCAIYSVSDLSSSVVCVSFLISDSVWLWFHSYTLKRTHLISPQPVFHEQWRQTQDRACHHRSAFEHAHTRRCQESVIRCSPWCEDQKIKLAYVYFCQDLRYVVTMVVGVRAPNRRSCLLSLDRKGQHWTCMFVNVLSHSAKFTINIDPVDTFHTLFHLSSKTWDR